MERSGFLVSPDDPTNPWKKPEPEPVFSHPYSCRPNTVVKDAHSLFSSPQPASFPDPHEHIVHSWPYTHSVNGHSFDLSICRRILVVTRFRNIGVRRGQQTQPQLVSPFRNRNSHSALRAAVPIAHLVRAFSAEYPPLQCTQYNPSSVQPPYCISARRIDLWWSDSAGAVLRKQRLRRIWREYKLAH